MVAPFTSLTPDPAQFLSIRSGDHVAFEHVLSSWRGQIEVAARSHSNNPTDRDACEAKAIVALWHACLGFPVESEVSFEKYARRTISNAIMDEVRDRVRKLRRGISLDAASGHKDSARLPLDQLIHEEELADLSSWIEQLDDRGRVIIRGIYFDNLTFAEIAVKIGLSKGAVSHIHKALLASAHTHMN